MIIGLSWSEIWIGTNLRGEGALNGLNLIKLNYTLELNI